MIGYYKGEGPDIFYNPDKSKDLVMVKLESFIETFLNSIDKVIVELFSGSNASIAEERFIKMFHAFNYSK
jgi:hypothetical protein